MPREAQARLERPPTLGESFGLEQRDRQTVFAFGKVRCQSESPAVAGDTGLEFSKVVERAAEVVMAHGKIRPQCDRGPQGVDRASQIAEFPLQPAEIRVGGGVLGR